MTWLDQLIGVQRKGRGCLLTSAVGVTVLLGEGSEKKGMNWRGDVAEIKAPHSLSVGIFKEC